jgi:molybdopterin-guanine dinucleotide biosynthesis protein A
MEMTGAILAGGKSRRMGRDKATLRMGDRVLIRHTYDVAKRVFSKILVVSSVHREIEGVEARMVRDFLPVSGSVTGIVSALLNAETPYVFVLGCDMPFLTEDGIRYLIDQVHGEDVIVPKTEAGFEPMHAIYGRSCISPMLTAIERGYMKVTDVFNSLTVRLVSPHPLFLNKGIPVFTNINTEEDLNRAAGILR